MSDVEIGFQAGWENTAEKLFFRPEFYRENTSVEPSNRRIKIPTLIKFFQNWYFSKEYTQIHCSAYNVFDFHDIFPLRKAKNQVWTFGHSIAT